MDEPGDCGEPGVRAQVRRQCLAEPTPASLRKCMSPESGHAEVGTTHVVI